MMAMSAFSGFFVAIISVLPIAHIGMAAKARTGIMVFRCFFPVARLAFYDTRMSKLVGSPIISGVALIAITRKVIGI